jgi:hypothetical protein
VKSLVASLAFCAACACLVSACAPIEYSVVIVDAATVAAEAEAAGAACTEEQLKGLSPSTSEAAHAPKVGTELASSIEGLPPPKMGEPMCAAPYEYYAALEYLHKARESVGYSRYEPAIEYAREARALARKAREIALTRQMERGRQK